MKFENEFDRDTAFETIVGNFVEEARQKLISFTLFTKNNYEVNWHHAHMAKVLERFARKEIPRLMVFMPPRVGKTELFSRRMPAYIFGQNPNARILATSYGADLAGHISRDVQRIMETMEFSFAFPNVQIPKEGVTKGKWVRQSEYFEIIGKSGYYKAAGIGGGITGLGGDYCLIDDPFKTQKEADSKAYRDMVWEWYQSVFYTRKEKDAVIGITMTRWHEDDLAGRLLTEASKNPEADQWTVVSYPMIKLEENDQDPRKIGEVLWPSKFAKSEVESMKTTLGSRKFNALHQQRPSSAQGNLLRREWWRFYTAAPDFDEVVQSWDMRFKDDKESGDYVVGQVWGRKGNDFYLVDQFRDRWSFTDTCKKIDALTNRHPLGYYKLIENKANGPAVESHMRNKITGIKLVEPDGGKFARASAVEPIIESGHVYLPDPMVYPWVKDFIEECSSFPKGAFDDQVDAMTQAINWFQSRSHNTLERLTKLI